MGIWTGTINVPNVKDCPVKPEQFAIPLATAHLKSIQKKAKELTLPHGTEAASLISKMTSGSGFSQLRAIDWKVWTMMMSPFCLAGILPTKLLDNWMLFVRAVRLICAPTVAIRAVGEAHTLFNQFVKGVDKIYGEGAVSINFHGLLHLVFDVLAHGSVYSFWLFFFERLNKDMKNTNNNNKLGVEKTLLKGFCKLSYYEDYVNSFPSKTREQVGAIEEYRRLTDTTYIPSLHSLRTNRFVHLSDLSFAIKKPNWKYPVGSEPMPTSVSQSIRVGNSSVMPKDDYLCLQSFYAKHSPFYTPYTMDTISNKIHKFDEVDLLGDTFKSKKGSKYYVHLKRSQY